MTIGQSEQKYEIQKMQGWGRGGIEKVISHTWGGGGEERGWRQMNPKVLLSLCI